MREGAGVVVSVAGCLAILAVLAGPYAVRSSADVATYYGSGVLNPLLVGVFALGVLVAFAAIRVSVLSRPTGAGVVLVLGGTAVLVAVAWAATARVDVFRAPGWLLPAQRFVLIGLAGLVVFGAGWYVRANDGLTEG